MNRRSSNRQNPFKSGAPNQGNYQQPNDFEQHQAQSYNRQVNDMQQHQAQLHNRQVNDMQQHQAQSYNRQFNGPPNQGNPNIQQNVSPKEPQHYPYTHNKRSYNGPTANVSEPRSGPCVLCKSATVLICSRCGDFYCSPTCQKNDWQTHRFICFLMPKLVHSSVDIYQNIPTLNGYQNRQLPETVSTPSSVQSQNRKWVSSNSPTRSLINYQTQRQQNNTQQQQQQQPQPQLHQQQQQQPNQKNQQKNTNQANQRPQKQHQNEPKQNHQTPPPKSIANGSEKSYDPIDMPKATNIGKVEQVPFPKSNTNILVTAIRSSNRIFLRSLEKPENDGYVHAMKLINEYGRNASPLKVMPSKNAFAITDFNDDGLFYRVQVISAKDENNIHVIYFDFGNEGTKKLTELRDISIECASLKQYVVMATLKNVPFIRDNTELIEHMKSFETVEGKIVYNEKEKPSCDIIIDGIESLNKEVNRFIQKSKTKNAGSPENQSKPQVKEEEKKQQHTAQKEDKKNEPKASPSTSTQGEVAAADSAPATSKPKSRPSQFVKPVMVPPFELILLPIKATNVEVMIVDNSLLHYNCIGCVLLEDKANLQEIQNYLTEYEDTKREYKPKVEEYVLARFQDGWYRAKVLDILSTEVVEVVFIDFLNESEVFIKDVRRYPMDLDLPCKTTLCLIQGLPNELTEKQVEYLKEKLQPGSQIKINEVVEKHEDGSDIAVCRINQVTQWMAEDKP